LSKKKIKKPNNEGGGEAWRTTFNDLMTLLMVFFVLIFAMSSIDLKKSTGLIGSLQSGLGAFEAGKRVDLTVIDVKPSTQEMENTVNNHREIYHDLLTNLKENTESVYNDEKIDNLTSDRPKKYLHALELLPGVETSYTDHGIYITLKEHILFHSGKADIHPNGIPVLNKIIDVVRPTKFKIRIEGHTDNVPIHTKQYPSNWELSIDRAVHVLKFFIQFGNISPKRLSAVGYGEVKPLVDNESAEHQATNRRVEIVLVDREKI